MSHFARVGIFNSGLHHDRFCILMIDLIYKNCSRQSHKILLVSFFMNEFLLSTIIWINRHYVFSINLYYLFSGSHKFYFVTDMKSSIMTKCDHLNFLCQKRKPIYDFLLSTKSFAKISYLDD